MRNSVYLYLNMRFSGKMVDRQKRYFSDDTTQLQLDQPVLGRHQGAQVIQKTQSNASAIRFE